MFLKVNISAFKPDPSYGRDNGSGAYGKGLE
jgi:hypothetical protein